ncbi:MAG TPA: P-loop NTPase fold protein [Nitrospiraceae bacterium]|jgi:hypothetical protein|nr:P-loop NTPase fold protein [Nitrospiraceae bacterium]
MLVRPPKLSVSEEDPFAADKLGRVGSANRLTHLLERVKPPFVLAIDAKYGNGKTTFIQMWMGHLKANGFRCLYFNAWEADFTSDPLIAFIGEMDAEISRMLGDSDSSTATRKVWKEVKEKGAYLAKRAIPVVAKIATAGILDLDNFTEQSLADLSADIAKEQIEKYDATKNAIKVFKTRLGEFIKSLNPSQTIPALPLVFFVDELDRCRPPYAIELLERIKHFFGIEEIVFVLAVDKAQLFSSIRSVYGRGIDADGYLRRFIDLEYRFPALSREHYYAHLVAQFGIMDLFAKIGIDDASGTVDRSVKMFRGLADVFGVSLRVQEQCFATLAIILMTAKPKSTQLELLVALLALQAADSELYAAFLSQKKGVKDVVSFITEMPKGRSFMKEPEGILLEKYLLKSRKDKDTSAKELIGSYKTIKNSYRSESGPQNQEQIRVEDIINSVLSETFNYDMVEEAASSIAFAEHFTPPKAPTGVQVT